MELDKYGWPQLPSVGSRIRFCGGSVLLQTMEECVIIRADHACNAAGSPGGNVTVQAENGDCVRVGLSDVRDHAELVQDGVEAINLERAMQWARKYG